MSIANGKRFLKVLIDLYIEIYKRTYQEQICNEQRMHAQMIMQMYITKAIAVDKLLDGLTFSTSTIRLNNIIDHTLLFMIARNMCEYMSAYELIHIFPDTKEKHSILCRLFECSCYKYRMKLYSDSMKETYHEQYIEEQQILDQCKQTIFTSNYYTKLPNKEQNKLKNSYQSILCDDFVKNVSWQEILSYYVKSNGIFDNIYNYFSINTHPSIIAMQQFDQAFAKENPEYERLCLVALRYIISFMSMFLQEYLKVSCKAKLIYATKKEEIKWLTQLYDYRSCK